MNYTQLFKTSQTLPMLCYDRTTPVVSLQANKYPMMSATNATKIIDALFQHVSVKHVQHAVDYRVLAARALAVMVARISRRGVANILFVPNSELEVYYQHSDHWYTKIIVDERLQPNELRAAFWRSTETFVDGGVQISPDGLMVAPGAAGYFVKCFL